MSTTLPFRSIVSLCSNYIKLLGELETKTKLKQHILTILKQKLPFSTDNYN